METRLYLSRAGLLTPGRVPVVDVDEEGIGKRDGDADSSNSKGQPGDDRGDSAVAAAGDEPARGADTDAAPVAPVTDEPSQDVVTDADAARDSNRKATDDYDVDVVTDSDAGTITNADDADAAADFNVVVDRDRRGRTDVTVDVVTETNPVEPDSVQADAVDQPVDTSVRGLRSNLKQATKNAPTTDAAVAIDADAQPVATRLVEAVRGRTAVKEDPTAVSDTDVVPADTDAPDVLVRVVPVPFTPQRPATPPVNTGGGTVDDRTVTITDPPTDATTPPIRDNDNDADASTPADSEVQTRPVPDAGDDSSSAVGDIDGDDADEEIEQPPEVDAEVPVATVEDETSAAGRRRDPQLAPIPPVASEIVERTGPAGTHQPRSVWRPESLTYGPTWRPSSDRSSLDMTMWMSQPELNDSSLQFLLDDEDNNAAVSDAAMLGILLLVLNRTRRRSVSDSILATNGSFEPIPDGSSAGPSRRRKRSTGSGRLPLPGGVFRTLADIPDPELPGGVAQGRVTFACDAVFADGATMALLYRRNFEAPRDSAGARSFSAMVSSFLAGGAYALRRLARGVRLARGGASRGGSALRSPARPRYSGPTV